MTATSQPIRRPATLRPATVAGLSRAIVGAVTTFASSAGAGLRDLVDAGQLGPDAEREIGRWSGGRI